jgi:hypothetical protein
VTKGARKVSRTASLSILVIDIVVWYVYDAVNECTQRHSKDSALGRNCFFGKLTICIRGHKHHA